MILTRDIAMPTDETLLTCDLFQKEVLIARQFKHPNVLPLQAAFVSRLDLFVVTPIMCYGSAKDTYKNCFKSGFPEPLAVLILRDLLSALDYLHRRHVVHRAIRASHILLDEHRAVLTGFRDCASLLVHGERVRRLHALPEHGQAGLNWLAPELLQQNLLGYNERSDVYSVGVTLCELCNGIEPFSDMKSTLMLTEKLRGNQPSLLDCTTCPDEENLIIDQSADPEELRLALEARQIYSTKQFSDHLHRFSEQCMALLPEDRPSVAQLLAHPVLKQTRHTSLQEQLQLHGIQAVDFRNIQDRSLELSEALDSLEVADERFEWDFE